MTSAIHSKAADVDAVTESILTPPALSTTPLPLVLAVVGHRDLIDEDKPRLRKQVELLLAKFAKQYPASKPFQLLCGLAEGADRLVAEIAVRKHIHLIACLPMPVELYEADFETTESRREFRDLLRQATHKVILPLVNGNTPENISHDSDRARERRDLQYAALGNHLVQHCQILIALWDGVDRGLPGGTSSVISRQRHGVFGEVNLHARNPLAFPETGPVYHILTPRQKNPAPVGNLETWQLLHHSGFNSEAEAEKRYHHLFHRMDVFNDDARNLKGDRAAILRSKDGIIPKKIREALPAPLENLIDHYATADALALSYQVRTRWVLRALIFLLGLGGVTLFELFAHGPEDTLAAFLLAYLLVIGGAYGVYRIANFRDVKTRHLDYRALAEGLRLQIFWKLSGLTDPVIDHYLGKQRSELDWIRDAIRRWTHSILAMSVPPDWNTVGQHWLNDQFSFFSNAARRNRKWHLVELCSYWALLLALMVIGIVVLVGQSGSFPALSQAFREPSFHGFSGHGVYVIIMTMLPALAGAITGYSLKMAFSQQRKQYDRMKDLYQRGLVCFEEAVQKDTIDRDKLIQKIVRELGKEALSENADWVFLHRERMVEMFVGG